MNNNSQRGYQFRLIGSYIYDAYPDVKAISHEEAVQVD